MNNSVLIVEDHPETLEMLQKIFEVEGYKVETVDTGEVALEKISVKSFDVIILDIMLPRVDGFEVCRRIKGNPKTKNILVVALTAFDVPDIVKKCISCGADDVVLKPFEPEDLIARVKKLLPQGVKEN